MSAPDPVPSVADLLCARAHDDHPGLLFEDRTWTWREAVAESARRAAWLLAVGEAAGEAAGPGAGAGAGEAEPLHVGVLLGNVPEYLFWLGGAALAGAVVVGINSTRRGEALAGDLLRTDCTMLVTDAEGGALLDGLDTGVAPDRVVRVDDRGAPAWRVGTAPDAASVAAVARPAAGDLFLLLFTSGTTGTPKAVRCTQGRLATIGQVAAQAYGYHRDDVAYCTMPLFHGNALMALWSPTLVAGGAVALAPRFSASGFLPDVRRFGATTFTYVGKALSYVLATPPRDDDATCALRRGFGTEASAADHAAFERRFGCVLVEGYGSSEGGVAITYTEDTPTGSLGRPREDVAIVDPATLVECPSARFDDAGRLVNGSEAVGEIVNRSGTGRFEGYYGDPAATEARTRNGWYWTGDLAYRDGAGFFYFAGRSGDWLRVDSENLSAGPIERVLVRFADAAAAAVYPVPDPRSGDQVMAALELLPGREFDPDTFARFLGAQSDLGTKWVPSFVRVAEALPQTASGRLTKGPLRAEGWWASHDPVYRRLPAAPAVPMAPAYRILGGQDRDALRSELARHGRAHLVDGQVAGGLPGVRPPDGR